MSLPHVINLLDIMDSPTVSGKDIKEYLKNIDGMVECQIKTISENGGNTDFVNIKIPGKNGKIKGGSSPTLGIIGRLGGIGARPEQQGFVSDGDGALCAVSASAKILAMANKGDQLEGDIIVSTHICPNAPTQPHEPVPFMDSPVNISTMNTHEIHSEMDAVLSIDTTKGNEIVNYRGFAITPTVKEGYILKVSKDLLYIYTQVTGKHPVTLPITTQDITPYGNGIDHINSILQPSVATDKPVVGVAITTETAVAGSSTGATHPLDIEQAVRYCIEVAKLFGNEKCSFYDVDEFAKLEKFYGKMTHLQTMKKVSE